MKNQISRLTDNFSPPVTPFLSVDKFAELTGQTPRSVKEQLINGQLPIYTLPTSARVKDKTNARAGRLFVDMYSLHVISIQRIHDKPELTRF